MKKYFLQIEGGDQTLELSENQYRKIWFLNTVVHTTTLDINKLTTPNSFKRGVIKCWMRPLNKIEMSDIYRIGFRCWNCGYYFYVNIPKGIAAAGNAGQCPRCGMQDKFNGKNHIVDTDREG